MTRRSLACVSGLMVAISSKKMVPWSATSKRPFLEATALVKGALELNVLVAKAAGLHGLSHLNEQLVVGPGLGDVVHGAVFERGTSHVDRAVGRNQNDRQLWIAAVNLFQDVEAVAVRQADVQQQKIERVLFELCEAGFAGLCAGDAVAFALQKDFEAFADFRFVINYKNRTLRHGPLSWPQGIRRGRKCLYRASSERQSFRRVL